SIPNHSWAEGDHRMKRALPVLLGTLLLGLLVAVPSLSAGAARNASLRSRARPVSALTPTRGTGRLTPGVRLLRNKGYLVRNQAAYERTKAEAAARAGQKAAALSPVPLVSQTPTPQVLQQWDGPTAGQVTPSDSTGAIGPSRYIEVMNQQFAIFDRRKNELSSGTLK